MFFQQKKAEYAARKRAGVHLPPKESRPEPVKPVDRGKSTISVVSGMAGEWINDRRSITGPVEIRISFEKSKSVWTVRGREILQAREAGGESLSAAGESWRLVMRGKNSRTFRVVPKSEATTLKIDPGMGLPEVRGPHRVELGGGKDGSAKLKPADQP